MKNLSDFRKIRTTILTCTGCFFLIINFSIFEVSAQEKSSADARPTTSPTVTPNPQPTPISVSLIISEKEKTTKRIQETNKKLSEQSTVSRIRIDLDELLFDLDEREQESNEVLSNSPSLNDLDKIQNYWSSLALALPSRKNRLQTQAAELSAELQQIQNDQAIWDLTLRELNEQSPQSEKGADTAENISPETDKTDSENENNFKAEPIGNLKAQVVEIIENLKKEQRNIQENFNQLLILQEKLSEQEERINEIVGKIDTSKNSLVSNLMLRDLPPIWNSESLVQGVQFESARSSSKELAAFKSYFVKNQELFFFHLLIIAALIYSFRRARRKTEEMIEHEPELKPTFKIFEYPTVSAIIVGLFLSSFLYFRAPELLGLIIRPLIVFTIFYLFSKLIEKRYFLILVALVVLYLVNDLSTLATRSSLLSRIIFLTEMAGGIIFLSWLIYSKNLVDRTLFQKIVCYLVLALFAFAFLSNALGYQNLARVVGEGLITSLSAGLIFYTLVKVVTSLFIFLFHIPPFSSLKMIQDERILIQRNIFRFLKWLAIVIWAIVTLNQFYLFDYFVGRITKIVTYEIGVGSIKFSPGDIVLLVFIIWFSFLFSRFIRFALDEDVYPRMRLAKGLPYATSTILHYLILLAGVFLALAAAGVDLTKFSIFLGALGVGVGIGLQNIVENFTSGLILLLERPIKVGDRIQMTKYQGQLKHIGLRSSIVRTGEGAEVIVPNGKLITEEVTNWTFSNAERRLDIKICVGYGADPEQVINLLEEVGNNHPDSLSERSPRAVFLDFGENTLDFQLSVWTEQQERSIYIKSDLVVGIFRTLKNAGIEIPHPLGKDVDEEISGDITQK